MSELKNCPFCGGEAEYCDGSITCTKCKATMGGSRKLELFAMWRKRQLDPRITELEKCLLMLLDGWVTPEEIRKQTGLPYDDCTKIFDVWKSISEKEIPHG